MRSSEPTEPAAQTHDAAAYLSLLLADGRLPVGAHTQSAGVEPGFRHGMRRADLPAYIAVRLRTVTLVEAATAVLAWNCLKDDSTEPLEALASVDAAWRARTVSEALREASDLLGRSYLRMAGRVWPVDLGDHRFARPVVVGVVAAVAGVGAEQLARIVAFDDVQTVVSAALKLDPFDPVEGVRLAVGVGADVERLVTAVCGIRSLEDLPAPSAPMIEHWAQAHQHEERRLFRA
ncbi:MAG: urease accessory protein UreF [Ornithinimicrobium sp.]|uniref:urease accessory protein UreF n=1 Tax=Ornithinimicrobium sp. TaxID=1977084 RepID=UPI003D9AF2B6